jgi:hypothetical protein
MKLKLNYPVIMHKKSAYGHFIAMTIPDLDNMRIDLSGEDAQQQLETLGFTAYAEKAILDVLIKKDEDDEDIQTPLTRKDHKSIKLDKHDIWTDVSVELTRAHRSDHCARFLPPAIMTTAVLNITAQVVQDIGAFELTEDSWFSLDDNTSRGLSVTGSLLAAAFKLIKLGVGQDTQFIGACGEALDDLNHQIKRMLGLKKSHTPLSTEEERSLYKTFLVKLAKACMIILATSQILMSANKAARSLFALNDKIASDPDTMFSSELLTAVAWTVFVLSQMNDPFPILKTLKASYNAIDNYFRPKPITKTTTDETSEYNDLAQIERSSSASNENTEKKSESHSSAPTFDATDIESGNRNNLHSPLLQSVFSIEDAEPNRRTKWSNFLWGNSNNKKKETPVAVATPATGARMKQGSSVS